jgi:hypothetical protein
MTQWFVIIGFLALLWNSTALAQEPTGFAGFAWGTPRVVVDTEFVKERCPWHTTYPTIRGHQRIVCSDYQMSTVGPVYLTLDFVGDVLTGYQVAVPRRLGWALRAAVPDLLATPAPTLPGKTRGTWRANVDISESQCLPSSVCLTVATSQAPQPSVRGAGGTGNRTDSAPAMGDRRNGARSPAAGSIVPSTESGRRPRIPQ